MRLLSLVTCLTVVSHAVAAPKADLNAKTLTGQPVRLKDSRGKLVVLNFWATWCVPCRDEMPMLVKAAQANTNPDLLFIAASVDDATTRGKVSESAQKYGIPFPVWTGATGDDLYRLSKGEAVPATLFIDRDGTVQAIVSGQITQAELTERLGWLNSERAGPKPRDFISHVK